MDILVGGGALWGRDSLKQRCDEVALSNGWGMIDIALVAVDLPIYTSTLNLTVERGRITKDSSIALLYVDILTDKNDNCSCGCS
jgi:hypothetical protein